MKKKLYVHMNFPGSPRKSYVPHTTFLEFWLLFQVPFLLTKKIIILQANLKLHTFLQFKKVILKLKKQNGVPVCAHEFSCFTKKGEQLPIIILVAVGLVQRSCICYGTVFKGLNTYFRSSFLGQLTFFGLLQLHLSLLLTVFVSERNNQVILLERLIRFVKRGTTPIT